MNINIQFQIECLATELVEMLMQKYGWDMKTALDVCYTLRKLLGDCAIRLAASIMRGLYMFSHI